MGYTHYYYTRKELDADAFKKVSDDFKKLVPVMEHLGVKLGDAFGENSPVINNEEIRFNGLSKCGHTERDLGITWPTKDAGGVAHLDRQHREGNQTMQNVQGSWFAGAQLETRTCGGDCSHETFSLEQKMHVPEWKQEDAKQNKRIFSCTKTAFKPYDLAVTACLIIAKHYLGNEIIIRSDGELTHWKDAMNLCEHFLGYGADFNIDPSMEEIEKAEALASPEATLIVLTPEIDLAKDVEVGDIFERSWGYEQTNVDFVKVIALTPSGKSAKVVKIGQKIVKDTGFMSETVIADPDKVLKEEPRTLRIRKTRDGRTVYVGEFWRWDGKQCHQSHYA